MILPIKGFHETSLIDWDGKIVSVLFVPGCNFRCPFCHNADLVLRPNLHESIPFAKIEQHLLEHKDFIDGICLTGGEPCLYDLTDFLRPIKQLGFLVKLDTNGAEPECLRQLIGAKLIDYVAMDVKGPLDERYDKLTGVRTDLSKIKQSVKMLMEGSLPYEFRVTVVPTLLSELDIVDLAGQIAGARKFALQQFTPENCLEEKLRSVRPYDKIVLRKMAEKARLFVPNTILRGVK